MWNKDIAIAHLNARANTHSLGRCAEYVRKAVEAGGLVLSRRASAKDYGESLRQVGFLVANNTPIRAGDIAVIQPINGHPHGHIAMYNGSKWVSDFRQNHGHYPGPSYRKFQLSFTVYRYGH